MKILRKQVLAAFTAKHPEAERRLDGWSVSLEQAAPASMNELKRSFRRIDYVPKDFTVFDVGGTSYRVVTTIDYIRQRVYIHGVFTHTEYNRWTTANRRK